jgi:hypothetical protein
MNRRAAAATNDHALSCDRCGSGFAGNGAGSTSNPGIRHLDRDQGSLQMRESRLWNKRSQCVFKMRLRVKRAVPAED